jgi:hypothetical protein
MGTTLSKTPESRMSTLARGIKKNASLVVQGLEERGLQEPSYHANGHAGFPVARVDKATLDARDRLLDLTGELRDITFGPRETLKELAWNVSLDLIRMFLISVSLICTIDCQLHCSKSYLGIPNRRGSAARRLSYIHGFDQESSRA